MSPRWFKGGWVLSFASFFNRGQLKKARICCLSEPTLIGRVLSSREANGKSQKLSYFEKIAEKQGCVTIPLNSITTSDENR